MNNSNYNYNKTKIIEKKSHGSGLSNNQYKEETKMSCVI